MKLGLFFSGLILFITGFAQEGEPAGIQIDNPEFHYGKHWLNLVDKIGFTDLMNGGLSDACSRVDWIEVYANPVKR